MGKNEVVHETCLLLVRHFRNLIAYGQVSEGYGFNTRVFSHMLHPEDKFVFIGTSIDLEEGEKPHPEHVVPCAVLIAECCRLIESNQPDEYIAKLLQKHWKVAHIRKEQAAKLDSKETGLKSTMPPGWSFENGDSLARLEEVRIVLSRPANIEEK